jgi:hypothetical protein
MEDSTETIKFMPGNWFQIRNYDKNKTIKYTKNEFEAEIINQLSNCIDNLSYLNINYGSDILQSKIVTVDFNLTDEKINKINKAMAKQNKHPIITFHGTTKEIALKILDTQYLVGGSGTKVKHGSAYGKGVYSSPHIGKAFSYATQTEGCSYILINIMILGKMQINVAGKEHKNDIDTLMVSGMDQFVSKKSENIIPIGYYVIDNKN